MECEKCNKQPQDQYDKESIEEYGLCVDCGKKEFKN